MIAYEGRCFYCKRALCYREATTDHFIPRSKGGANSTANRVLACTDCNTAKRDLDPRTFGLETPHESTLWVVVVSASVVRSSVSGPAGDSR